MNNDQPTYFNPMSIAVAWVKSSWAIDYTNPVPEAQGLTPYLHQFVETNIVHRSPVL